MRARLARVAKLIEEKGLERVGEPHVKHIEGRIWEMRLKGRSGISRALYVTAVGRRVVIVRVFIGNFPVQPYRLVFLPVPSLAHVGSRRSRPNIGPVPAGSARFTAKPLFEQGGKS